MQPCSHFYALAENPLHFDIPFCFYIAQCAFDHCIDFSKRVNTGQKSARSPGKYWSHSAQIATALCKGAQGRRRQRKTHIWCRRLTTTQVTNGSGKVRCPRPATQKISSSGKYFCERKTEVFLFLLSLKLFLPSLAQLATQELWAFPRKQSL